MIGKANHRIGTAPLRATWGLLLVRIEPAGAAPLETKPKDGESPPLRNGGSALPLTASDSVRRKNDDRAVLAGMALPIVFYAATMLVWRMTDGD